jgi:hypothetical protein
MEPVKRKAGRPPTQTLAEKPGPPLRITVDADRVLTQQSKKLKMSKGKYASAAIAFFAESGLDPTVERPQGLASVSRKVEGGVASVREHNADIGNRLYALVRGFERTMYAFMQQQQLANYSYFESIESNLLRHLVSLEDSLLEPMVEQIMKARFEARAGRIVSERSQLAIMEQPGTEWEKQHEQNNVERNRMLIGTLKHFVKNHKVPTPHPTPKPGATPVPDKPVIPPSAASPVSPKS